MTTDSCKKIVIMGFGGHARSVADVALACGYEDLLFVDTNAEPGENFLGYPVLKDSSGLDGSWRVAFAASGDGFQRLHQFQMIEALGMSLVSLVSPLASIGVGSDIAPGCFVGHHAHIGPLARIDRGSIVNTGSIIEHESSVGEFSHVSVNSTIAGRSKLGSFSMLGAGATIIDSISTVDHVIVGAGAVVVGCIDVSGVYVGVPARLLK
jgi:UDP-N-acetylbacillosamine N-acetyltransferase